MLHPTIERLQELFSYDPLTGLVTRRIARARAAAGTVAGTITRSGYLSVGVDGGEYYIHRIAWAIYFGAWPTWEIDHANRDKADNRITNLRQASRSENIANLATSRRNTSGIKGVSFHKGAGKWTAQIKFDGKQRYLGLHETKEQAAAAYQWAAIAAFGEFACFETRVNP